MAAPLSAPEGHIIKKETDRHIKGSGQIIKPGCAYAVCAAFIFLHLLKCDAERFPQLFL